MPLASPGPDFSGGFTNTSRVLVTGGSGFIGTNLVASYRAAGVTVANADIQQPRNSADADLWAPVDTTRIDDVRAVVFRFRPTHVFHLAARTDLRGRKVADYPANVEGMAALLSALTETSPPMVRLVVASSLMVCRIGYQPVSDLDYCPSTAYGASKVETERLVRSRVGIPWPTASSPLLDDSIIGGGFSRPRVR
jgi:nucleoside-diphosphate-sugar epimerase